MLGLSPREAEALRQLEEEQGLEVEEDSSYLHPEESCVLQTLVARRCAVEVPLENRCIDGKWYHDFTYDITPLGRLALRVHAVHAMVLTLTQAPNP